MIPQAGSAYAYSYATLGELVAWIIGWDLILEYAVGNIAVAIAWSGYFTSLLSGVGIVLPPWLTHGYRTALLSSDPAVHDLLQTAPHLGPHSAAPESSRRSAIVLLDHLAALHRCARERPREQHHGRSEAAGAEPVRCARRDAHRHGQLPSVRAERMARNPSGGGDRVLRVYRLRRHLDGSRRDAQSRSGTCPSVFLAGWPSAR